MPTQLEFQELFDNCTWTWITQGDHNGCKVTSKSNGNSIFLPAAGMYYDVYFTSGQGHYWSSSLYYENAPSLSWCVIFDWRGWGLSWNSREYGLSVRPVFYDGIPLSVFSLSVEQLYFTSANKTKSISISSNQSWTISSFESWLSLSQTSGTDDASVMVTVEENTSTSSRSGTITFKAGGKDYTVGITQDGSPDPNSHEYVDLGLPSGLLWATCNIGANSPADYGYYFAWGETTPKDSYLLRTYEWWNGSSGTLTKYSHSVLDLNDDAAHVNWGGDWRMPTIDEWKELHSRCSWTWTNQDGHNGCKVTSMSNGNSIFLPVAGWRDEQGLNYAGKDGFYWSSSHYDYGDTAWDDSFYSAGYGQDNCYGKYRGHSIRPVCKP